MLLYFTGTGNSMAAAAAIGKITGEEPEDMGKRLREEDFGLTLSEGEALGIVFPVYYGGLPTAVNEFISKMKLSSVPSFVYGVMTYGGVPAACREMLGKALSDAGLRLDAAYEVKMPANYAVLYEPTSQDKEGPILEKAEKDLSDIAVLIRDRVSVPVRSGAVQKLMSAVMYPLYQSGRKTAPFHTNDKCVHCGICASRCPVRAIEMVDGTPTWVKDRCVFCMSCVRCGAIEYGKKLTGRYRYKHPSLRKGSGPHDAEGHDGFSGAHDHSGGSGSCYDDREKKEEKCC